MIQSTKQINKFDIYARERRYGNKVLANMNIKMLKQNRIIEFQFDIEIRAVHNTEMEWMRYFYRSHTSQTIEKSQNK